MIEVRKKYRQKEPKSYKNKKGKMILLSNCVVCSSKKSRFIKEQETYGIIVASLAITLCNIYVTDPVLF